MRFYLKTWFIVLLIISATVLIFFILFLSGIAEEMELSGRDVAREAISANFINKNKDNFAITDYSPDFGNKKSKVVIVEFSDFGCPFCKEESYILKRIFNKYKDKIYFQYRHFPITELHPFAKLAAEASMCANDQGKFWDYHDLIFYNQAELNNDLVLNLAGDAGLDQELFNECVKSNKYSYIVDKDIADGKDRGVFATPTFFVNGKKVQGVVPFDVWDKIIKELSN